MATKEEIKILGDGYLVWCSWCRALKRTPENCDYCFKTITLPIVEIKYGN